MHVMAVPVSGDSATQSTQIWASLPRKFQIVRHGLHVCVNMNASEPGMYCMGDEQRGE